VIVDQSEGTTSRTGGNRGYAGMGGGYDVTEQSHLISSMAHPYRVLPTGPGHSTAQAVIHRPPTAAAWVRAQVNSYGICGAQSGIGADFLRVLRFLLPIFIPPTAPHLSSSIIRGWSNRPSVADVLSGLAHRNREKKNYLPDQWNLELMVMPLQPL
jgi:hypothetical protein